MKTNKTSHKSRLQNLADRPVLNVILSLLVNASFIYAIFFLSRFSKIQGDIFALVIFLVVLILLVLNVVFFAGYAKRIVVFRKVFFVAASIMLIFGIVGNFYMVRTQVSLNNLVNNNATEIVDYSVIGFSKADTEKEMDRGTLGFIAHDEALDSALKSKLQPLTRSIKYKEYEDFHSLLSASLAGDIQYALVPKDYTRLQESFENENVDKMPFDDAHVLFTFSTKVKENVSNVNTLTTPFTVLMLGNNEGLSDSIMIASVNPQTLKVTMSSIARDSYVPIACYQGNARDKLNHSRGRSRQCIINTVEDFIGIDIDFYFETDFYALVKIVDALGGLELESPVAFAGSLPKEDNPKEYEGISIPKGVSMMNGKQAITFARERHHMPRGDFDRQINQQYVIKEVANALLKERNPEKLVSALEGASKNITTNLSVDTMAALMGYALEQSEASFLDPMSTIRIYQSQLVGTTPMINGMSVILPFKNDVISTRQLIQKNLKGTLELSNERSFSFSVNNPYYMDGIDDVIGGDSSGGTVSSAGAQVNTNDDEVDTTPSAMIVVPDFSGMSQTQIETWAKKNKAKVSIVIVDKNHSSYRDHFDDGQILYQNFEAGERISNDKTISVSIVKKSDGTVETPVAKITVPDFSGKKKRDVESWASSNNVKVAFNGDAGLVTSQTHKGEYTLAELSKFTVTLTAQETEKEPVAADGYDALAKYAKNNGYAINNLDTNGKLLEAGNLNPRKIVGIKYHKNTMQLDITWSKLDTDPVE